MEGQTMDDAQPRRRQGICRICFEDGEYGELLAPCLCKGTSRWVHRQCLDSWRVSGANPRALSNCTTCGFQYHLELHRTETDDIEERQHKFLQRLAHQTVLAFILVQASIAALGMLVRYVDHSERLVRFFGLPQEPGQTVPGDFWNAMLHHKTTYYIAGLIAFLFIVGLVSLVFGTMMACSRGPAGRLDACDAYGCYYGCHDCSGSCDGCCGSMPGAGSAAACDCDGGGGDGAVVVFLILVAVLVILGILVALVFAVCAVQHMAKKYAQLSELRFLASEYRVQDLADPEEGLSDETVSAKPARPADEPEVMRQLTSDLNALFGTAPSASSRGHSYGSVDGKV